MTDTYNPSAIEDADWVDWLVIFNDRARNFIGEFAQETAGSDDPRALSAKFAIAARALTLIHSALVLLQNEEQLAFRIMARGIIECAMHMESACTTAEYLPILYDDDQASRISRGKLLQKSTQLSEEANRELQQFVMAVGENKPKILNIGELSKGSNFPRFQLFYRQISADAEHVTWTSLCRHPQETYDRVTLELDPQLEDEEMFDTISLIALAAMTVVLHLRHSLEITQNEVEFSALGRRYSELYHEGVAEFRGRHKDGDPGTCSEDFSTRKQ
ncbi:hypothetical protein [Aureimonas glaciei]|uniref:Uncharacterized protein n=1 Tax=Aureimonas glaciei TaxID=1776957 RepID=A0A916XUJ8_9HYPH|nr:hypothetical protein [Aureimonas glaciei]GGD11082.1 hypothetical protein GCM10011335_12530 [Aureimonas glaciei]